MGSASARPANPLQALGQLRLRLVGLVEALADNRLGKQLLLADVARVVVGVLIPAAVLPGPGSGAQPPRHGRGAVLAHVALRRRQRPSGGVGLRRQRQVDGGLGERVARLRQPHVLDRGGRGGGERERRRVGVADVLGGEDHHPPHDEPRVLAALEHHREVVQRRVGVRAAGGLDPRGDVVVVAVALLVVEDGSTLQGVLDARERHALADLRSVPELPRGGGGQLERVQGGARVAFAAGREELDRRVLDLGRPRARALRRLPARAVAAPHQLRGRAPQDRRDLLGRERLQRVHAQARQESAVDLERGVLGGGADERHQVLLDGRQQRVLLGLVEAVDLVEEQHRAPVAEARGGVTRARSPRAPPRARRRPR